MGTVAYARQALYDAAPLPRGVGGLREGARGQEAARATTPALAAWQDVLAGRETLIVTASRANDIRRALALADEFKIKVAVAGAPQAARLAEPLKERKLPLLVSVNFDPPRAAASSAARTRSKERKDIEEAERNPAELHKAGVTFALVSGHAPTSWPASARPSRRACRGTSPCARSPCARPRRWAWPTAWAAWRRARSRTSWPGRGEPLTKDAKVKMVFVDGQLYEPEEKAEAKKDADRPTKPDRRPTER